MPLNYVRGDATAPSGDGNRVIAHVCNDIGRWGAGFVMAVSRRWPEPEKAYHAWYADRATNDFALGSIQVVQVEPTLWVANMVGQHRLRRGPEGPPIRYDAIEQCLEKLAEWSETNNASVHMPRIGCGLAGGRWEQIEPIIERTLLARDLGVTVYDLPS